MAPPPAASHPGHAADPHLVPTSTRPLIRATLAPADSAGTGGRARTLGHRTGATRSDSSSQTPAARGRLDRPTGSRTPHHRRHPRSAPSRSRVDPGELPGTAHPHRRRVPSTTIDPTPGAFTSSIPVGANSEAAGTGAHECSRRRPGERRWPPTPGRRPIAAAGAGVRRLAGHSEPARGRDPRHEQQARSATAHSPPPGAPCATSAMRTAIHLRRHHGPSRPTRGLGPRPEPQPGTIG